MITLVVGGVFVSVLVIALIALRGFIQRVDIAPGARVRVTTGVYAGAVGTVLQLQTDPVGGPTYYVTKLDRSGLTAAYERGQLERI